MKYAEIWSHVVEGFRVTCPRFGPGTFVDYQFNGLRINHAGGSSSGFSPTDEDKVVEWSLVADEIELPNVTTKEQAARQAKADVWGKPKGDAPAPIVGSTAPRDAWGRPLQPPGKWGK